MYIKYCTFKSQTVFLDNFTCPCLYFEFVYFWIISNFVSTFVSIFINFLLSFISTIIIFPILSSPFPILFVKLVHSIPLLPPQKNSFKICRARNASWSRNNIEIPQETPFPLTFLGCCKNFTTTLHPPSCIKLSSVVGNTFHRNVGRIGK